MIGEKTNHENRKTKTEEMQTMEIPKDEEKFKEVLGNVFDSIVKAADEHRKETDSYKNLFGASEHGIRGLLSDAHDKMMSIVLDVVQVIEDRTGSTVNNDFFYLLCALPLARQVMSMNISNNDGLTCSVDKARELAKDMALDALVAKASSREAENS